MMDPNALNHDVIQAAGIDQEEIAALFQKWTDRSMQDVDYSNLSPAPYVALNDPVRMKAQSLGEQAIRDGRVAAFTVAGGQGTRLGYDGPKGEFPATPVQQNHFFNCLLKRFVPPRFSIIPVSIGS